MAPRRQRLASAGPRGTMPPPTRPWATACSTTWRWQQSMHSSGWASRRCARVREGCVVDVWVGVPVVVVGGWAGLTWWRLQSLWSLQSGGEGSPHPTGNKLTDPVEAWRNPCCEFESRWTSARHQERLQSRSCGVWHQGCEAPQALPPPCRPPHLHRGGTPSVSPAHHFLGPAGAHLGL